MGGVLTRKSGFSASNWTPAELFAGSEKGGYWNVEQANVWSDNGSTQITDGGSVYRIDDLSGNGNHWLQTTSGSRPVWHTNGGTPYVQFDGTDDFMTAALPANITGTAATGAVAARYDTGATNFGRFAGMTNSTQETYNNLASLLFSYRASGDAVILYNSVAGTGLALSADTDVVLITGLTASNLTSKKDAGSINSSAHGLSPNLNSDTLRLFSDNGGVNVQMGRFQGGFISDQTLDSTVSANLATWLGATQGRSI